MKKEYSAKNMVMMFNGEEILGGYEYNQEENNIHEYKTSMKIKLNGLDEVELFICGCISCTDKIERLRNLK